MSKRCLCWPEGPPGSPHSRTVNRDKKQAPTQLDTCSPGAELSLTNPGALYLGTEIINDTTHKGSCAWCSANTPPDTARHWWSLGTGTALLRGLLYKPAWQCNSKVNPWQTIFHTCAGDLCCAFMTCWQWWGPLPGVRCNTFPLHITAECHYIISKYLLHPATCCPLPCQAHLAVSSVQWENAHTNPCTAPPIAHKSTGPRWPFHSLHSHAATKRQKALQILSQCLRLLMVQEQDKASLVPAEAFLLSHTIMSEPH